VTHTETRPGHERDAAGAVHTADTATGGRWFHTTKRVYLLDFQMPDSSDQATIGQPVNLRNINVPAIVAQLHDAGVKTLIVHAKDNQGNCYYNTGVGHKHTGIGEQDLMAAFSRECRARDMRIMYYVQLSRERRSFAHEAHRARHADGSPVMLDDDTPLLPSREERPVVCLNGPHREYILAIVRELSANYTFDGFWLDCFAWWGRIPCCYCDTCRAKYREDTGRDLPPGPPATDEAWRTYLQWRHRLNALIYEEITDAIRAANPQVTITHNGATQVYANDGFYDHDDYVSSEFHYDEGLGRLSLNCRKKRALKPGVPFETEIWRFFNRLGDTLRGYQIRPLPMHLTEMTTVVAHGGFVQYYDQINPDGTLDARSIAVMKAAFAEIARREPWLAAGEPVPFAGIVQSHGTETYAQAEHVRLYRTALMGAHHALMEAHLPFDLLTDRQVARGEFGTRKVLVLPNIVCLSDAQVAHLRAFVEAGGGLVATHRTSLCDEHGRPRPDFALADVFGIQYREPLSYLYSFVQAGVAHPVTEGVALDWPMTLWKTPQLKVAKDAARDAQVLGTVVYPMRGFHMGYPPQEVTDHPGIVAHTYGKGRVVYFPAPIDAVYGEYGHPDYRQLLVNAVRWAANAPVPVEVQAPLTVEAVSWLQGGGERLVVHLLNRTAAGNARAVSAVVQEVIPVHNVVVRVQTGQPWTKATLQPSGVVLRVETPLPGTMAVTVPQLDIHEMLVFER